MMVIIRRSRILITVPLFCLALLGLRWLRFGGHLIQQHSLHSTPPANTTTSGAASSSSYYNSTLIPFWNAVSKALLDSKPPCELPDDEIKAPVARFAKLKKGSKRPDLLKLPQQDVEGLRDAHSRFVAQILQLAPRLPYIKGTRGIVTTAAGEFLPTLVVSLRMLRRTGSKLPIQVLVESNGVYEEEICEEVLPAMNATCFILSGILDAVPKHVEITMPRFQLRVFAMLISSFDEVLLLDADSITVEKPEEWMNAEPFISTGFVSWPDYWASTASPKYFEISSQPIPSLAGKASSESGQLLLSKSKHASTLLLSLYYNYYGPSHYYKLLSQCSVGQGDKETYLAAATSLNASFYTVATNVEELGYYHDTSFTGCGASQFNAEDDYNKHIIRNQSIKDLRRSFVHAQTYRMNAASVVDLFRNEINARMWGPKEKMVEKFGRDLEKQLWAETLATGCQYERYFSDWRGLRMVCKNIGQVYNFISTL